MLHDFTTITPASVATTTDEAIRAADLLIDGAATPDAPRSYAATLFPLEAAGTIISDAYGKGPFMARVHPDAAVRDEATRQEERLAKWGTDLMFRRDLYTAISEFAATGEAAALTGTKRRLLDEWVRDFRRAGHELDTADRDRLQGLKQRLVELQVQFNKTLDEWDDHIEVTADDLEGMPEGYAAGLRPGSREGTYLVSMEYPDYVPFMQQARRRDLREALQFKFWNRAAAENRPLLEEAIATREQMAVTLGYPTWADYAMEVKMAKTPAAVAAFYESIVPGLTAKAQGELETMSKLFEADYPGETLASWDWAFYHNEQKKGDFGVDANEVAAYFPLDEVLAGMFAVTGDVFELEYNRVDDAKAWHPDVALYEIRDRGSDQPRAYFYADLFPREGKFGHAAAFSIVYGEELADGTYRVPVAAIVANFTKPTADQPSLLKHSEALTLWHEFGHILHFCLTEVDLVRFSGFDTEWDFVEAPSQIMEHWMWQPQVLQRFARHHETREPIPTDLVERLIAARDLNVGLHTVRQVFLGQVDLMMHDGRPDKDLDRITREAYAYTLLPFHQGTFFVASFGHLMGGYDAGYYGYLWSKVYGDDMFSVFEAEGITSPEVGARYRREVLAQGGSRDAIDHLRAFLGREPSSEAFLRNLGLDG